MKRTYKYALTVVLGLGMVAPAFAQDGFPDVKDTHWAADSVNRLKLTGLIHGDSDGNFNGNRTMTRYEVASIVYAVYSKLVGFNEEVEKNLKALEAKINSIKVPEGGNVDLSDIKTSISDLQKEVGTMKAWSSDLAQLKRMTSNYANELRSLGADANQMKSKISDLAARISKLEKAPQSITVSGDANFWMGSASKADGSTGVVNQDGRYLQGFSTGAGMDNLQVFHELGLKIEDKTSSVPYKAEFVVGNTVGDTFNSGFGNQSYNPANLGQPMTSGATTVYLHELTANLKNIGLTVGRQGLKLNKFILSRPDVTSFYSNSRWDDHTWRMDGGVVDFANGAGTVFFGTSNQTITTGGTNVQPLAMNGFGVDRMMGATYDIKFGTDNKGKIGLSYVDFDGSLGFNTILLSSGTALPQGQILPPDTGVTRVNVYGADLNYDFGGFTLEGGAGKSVAYGIADSEENNSLSTGSATHNLDTLIDTANGRWNAAVGLKNDSYALKVGYRNVEANYAAPGDWGRVSIFRNLTDTKALNVYGRFKLGGSLNAHGWYEKGDAITGVGSYKSWKAGLGYQLTSKWGLDAMYEDTKFEGGFQGITNGANSKFTTVNLGYDLGTSTMLKMFWQNADLTNVITANGIGSAQKGSFYGCQFSVKF